MRFLVDACVSDEVARYLDRAGCEVAVVEERDPRMLDHEVLKWAETESRVLVTNDEDFGRYIFLLRKSHCGVVRLPSAQARIQLDLMTKILAEHEGDLLEGAVITATQDRLRVRHMRETE